MDWAASLCAGGHGTIAIGGVMKVELKYCAA